MKTFFDIESCNIIVNCMHACTQGNYACRETMHACVYMQLHVYTWSLSLALSTGKLILVVFFLSEVVLRSCELDTKLFLVTIMLKHRRPYVYS